MLELYNNRKIFEAKPDLEIIFENFWRESNMENSNLYSEHEMKSSQERYFSCLFVGGVSLD